MEDKNTKPTIEIIYLLNRDVIVASDGGIVNNGDGSYGLPEVPLP